MVFGAVLQQAAEGSFSLEDMMAYVDLGMLAVVA